MSDRQANLTATTLRTQPVSVTRKMAASLTTLQHAFAESGRKVHHLGAGYPNPEVTDPRSFIAATDRWFTHLAKQEGLNDAESTPAFLSNAYAYTDTLGPIGPRESFAQVYGADWNIDIDPSKLLPTIGATGGINLLCSIFERSGQQLAYITDAPTYAGFIARATLNQRARLYSVEMDEHGPDPKALAGQIKAARDAGFFVPFYYTVPDGHNPAGISFGTQRRHELMDVVRSEGILIVEDAPYLYINYLDEGDRQPPFCSIDATQTVHLFTGSKIGLPGPRLGYLYSDATVAIDTEQVPLTELALSESSASILFHNPLALLTFEALLREADGTLRRSLWPIADEKLRVYRENRAIVMTELQRGLSGYPDVFSWTKPQAGFFTVLKIHADDIRVDDAFVEHLTMAYGVVIVPMYDFYPADARQRNPNAGLNEIRVSFCFTESKGETRRHDLAAAVQALCAALLAELKLV